MADKYKSFFVTHKDIIVVLFSLLLLAYPIMKIVFLLFNIITSSVLVNGYNELRDYASIRLTHMIIEGNNPYTLDVLDNYKSPMIFLYTPLYPLMVAVVCKLTGVSIITGYYVVNVLLVASTVISMWMIIKDWFDKYKCVALICTAVTATTFFALFGLPIFNFHTDTVGIFITSLMFLIVYKKKENVLALAVLSVLIIFTKQILLIFVVPLFIYYLIVDRKLALKYFLYCVACGVITVGVMQFFFPLYWTETIYSQYAVNGDAGSWDSAKLNLQFFYNRYCVYVLMFFIGAVSGIVISIRSKTIMKPVSFIKAFIKEHEYVVYLSLNVLFGTLSLMYFAKVDSDGYKYCQDILAPSVFLLAVYVWRKGFAVLLEKKYAFTNVLILVLCFATTITYAQFHTKYYTREGIANCVNLDNVIAKHEGEKMYLGLTSLAYMLNRDMWESENIWINDGQIEFFDDVYEADGFIGSLFYDEEIVQVSQDYVDQVNEMVSNKEFDVVVTCAECIIDSDNLARHYREEGVYLIMTDTNGYVAVIVWTPRIISR